MIQLDDNDPFDQAVAKIVEVNRRKRLDYAQDEDPFSNFYGTSQNLGIDGFGAKEAVLFNILQKVERLKSLRVNGRIDDAKNESVGDTYWDLATYAVILYALHLESSDVVDESLMLDYKVTPNVNYSGHK